MASGTPVLASNNAMLKEIIDPGVNGALYEGSDIGLGNAISKLLENKEQLRIWGMNARQKALELYSLDRNIVKLERYLLNSETTIR